MLKGFMAGLYLHFVVSSASALAEPVTPLLQQLDLLEIQLRSVFCYIPKLLHHKPKLEALN